MPGHDDGGEAEPIEQVGAAPGPQGATSPPEFVAAMRALKQWSGFTYRQLQRRAEAAGDVLPHSTTAAVLGRATLPRENVVAAFVRACGGDAATVAVWLADRRRIAVATAQPATTVPITTITSATDAPAPAAPDVPATTPATPSASPLPSASTPSATPPSASTPSAEPTTAEPTTAEPTTAESESWLTEQPAVLSGIDRLDPLTASWADLTDPGVTTPTSDQPATDPAERDQPPTDPATTDQPDSDSSQPPTPLDIDQAPAPADVEPPLASAAPPSAPPPMDVAEAAAEATDRDSPVPDKPVPAFSDGKLASTVASKKDEQWVGLHRYDPAVEVPRPAGLRWLIPPIMYRTGWSTRVLSGVLVLILALIAIGATARFLRDDDAGQAADPDVVTDTTMDPDPELETPGPDETAPAQPTRTPSPKPTPATTTPTAPKPSGPPVGPVQIRLAHSGLCIGEGPEPGNPGKIVFGQYSCATASPPTTLERVSGNVYRIKTNHPEFGVGCATVDNGGTAEELLIAPDNCDGSRTDQKFVIEPVTKPAVGFRIRSAASTSGICIGAFAAGQGSGTQLIQVGCEGGKHEVFTFTRR